LVTPYLIQQLWLPALIWLSSLIGVSVAGGLGIKYLMSLKKNWQLKIMEERVEMF